MSQQTALLQKTRRSWREKIALTPSPDSYWFPSEEVRGVAETLRIEEVAEAKALLEDTALRYGTKVHVSVEEGLEARAL